MGIEGPKTEGNESADLLKESIKNLDKKLAALEGLSQETGLDFFDRGSDLWERYDRLSYIKNREELGDEEVLSQLESILGEVVSIAVEKGIDPKNVSDDGLLNHFQRYEMENREASARLAKSRVEGKSPEDALMDDLFRKDSIN